MTGSQSAFCVDFPRQARPSLRFPTDSLLNEKLSATSLSGKRIKVAKAEVEIKIYFQRICSRQLLKIIIERAK
jgi:hypothetical protein